MKNRTMISLILISLGATTLLAQPKRDDKRDDRRYDDRKPIVQVQPSRAPAPARPIEVHKKAPAVVYKAPAPKPAPKPVVYVNNHHHNKKIVVKPKPRPTLLGSIIRVIAPPPPSRAVVILNATPSNPVYEMTQLDREPQLVQSPSIEYPETMANAGVSGEVNLLVQIDKDGYVGLERVISSTNSDFERAAIASLSTFKYEEPLKDGYRVNARLNLTIPFEISN